ncbi:MAG TPA: carbon-nitrogen hydrolase family protein [Tepidisphaeraceae bacterium]|nr:carbon-nitrogen hydrolase family protein [Tepidisphaeraceae bacterium]
MAERSAFQLAMVQMRVEGGQRERNLERAGRCIEEAAKHGARVIVLPEAMDLGWTHPSAKEGAQGIPEGQTCAMLREAAKRHGVYVCSGLTEKAAENVYNSAVLIDPKGAVILHHRKLNELEIGHEYYAQGDRLGVVKTEFGTIGVMICADAFVRGQVVSRTLGLMGAEVILSPSAWAVEAEHDQQKQPYGTLWLDNYGPVARDFRMWIAGVSNVGRLVAGPWKGRKCIGCSLLVGPEGQQVVMGPYGEEAETILYAEIMPEQRTVRGCGWERVWTERE